MKGATFLLCAYRGRRTEPLQPEARVAGTDEEIILDVNAHAESHYTPLPEVSSRATEAWADTCAAGSTDRIRNLNRVRLPEAIEGASGNMVWAEDNRTLFYTKRDPGTLRSFQIYRHRVGNDPAEDVLVYQEDDEEFSSRVRKTKSKRYIVISSSHTLADEHRFLAAGDPEGEFTLFLPRERGHEHRFDHLGDHFYIRTNLEGAENFKLMRTPVASTATGNWRRSSPTGATSSCRGSSCSGLPRPLGARGRAHPPARPCVGRGGARDRVRRAGLPGLPVGQSRGGHERSSLRVHVPLRAALGLRLRHVHA